MDCMQMPLFMGEPCANLSAMAGGAKEAHFTEHQVILRQGQEPEDLFIVCRGDIRVRHASFVLSGN